MLFSQDVISLHQVHGNISVSLPNELSRALVLHDVEETSVDERVVLFRQLRQALHKTAVAYYLEQLVSALSSLLLQNCLNEVLTYLPDVSLPRENVCDHLLHVLVVVELYEFQKIVVDKGLQRFKSLLLAVGLN